MQDMSAQAVRTRIGPSPTGFPHIGTIYQTLLDFSYAKKNKGKFILRIEDTDRERFVEDAEKKMYEALDWTGLIEDESPRKDGPFGPYKQSERLNIYKKYAQQLIDEGKAYFCFCSKERLEQVRKKLQEEKKPIIYDKHCRNLSKEEVAEKLAKKEGFVVRMKIPENKKIIVRDEIRGDIEFESNLIDDQVILKSDGYPTYHLAVVIDDHLMEITHLVRAEEWLSSTPKHFILYEYFGWNRPLFFHTPTLRNPDKSKLSKRHSHTNIEWYKENGFLPEAILNFLALMGWSHPDEKEIFPLKEFINLFELKDLKPVGPIFDLQKLEWMNGVWIRSLTLEDLKKRIVEFYSKDKTIINVIKNQPSIDAIIELAQTRIKTLAEFKDSVLDPIYGEAKNLTSQEQEIGNDLRIKLQLIEDKDWKEDKIFSVFKGVMNEKNVKMPILYKIFTGQEKGLPLPQVLEKIGKKETLKKLR